MRWLLVAFAWLLAAAAPLPKVTNLADDFVAIWDRTQGLPDAERVAIFKAAMAPRFPGFYDAARFEGRVTQAQVDAQLARGFRRFPAQRGAFVAATRRFDAALRNSLPAFQRAFPDFRQTAPIWLLNSFGEMDGGTREIAGRTHLIFGADVIAQVHKDFRSEAPFLHHELFHMLHEPRLGICEAVWCSLWSEGLAVLVAERLNPGASEDELLLTAPNNMAARTRAALPAAWADLLPRLQREGPEAMGMLFGTDAKGDGTDLPQRRGYLLGLLVARELAKDHSLRDLAAMPASEARPLVLAAVRRLAEPVH